MFQNTVLLKCIFIVKSELFGKGGLNMSVASVIKYEGDNSTFIWKHPCEDFNSLTQLIVHESQWFRQQFDNFFNYTLHDIINSFVKVFIRYLLPFVN